MVVALSSKVVAKSGTFSTSVGDDLVLFDPEQGAYYGSGMVGEQIWSLIADEQEVRSICDSLLERFEVERQTCEAQVLEFLGELNEHGLIHVA